MKRIGIRDVARRAGVSPAAVSRYLNQSGYVSEDSATRIREAIQEMDYTPNELARNLFKNRSGIVAVLVPDSEHPFFSAYTRSLESELYKRGYGMILCNTVNSRGSSERQLFDMLKRHIVDGIITGVHTTENDKFYAEIQEPIVTLDRAIGDIPMVASDHAAAGAMAARLLLERGCRRVLDFSDDEYVSTPAHMLHVVLADTLRKGGAEVVAWRYPSNDFTFGSYRERANAAYEAHPGVDAAFGTDLYVMYYMQRAISDGRRIPEDLRLVAYDGTSVTDVLSPRLTVIRQRIPELAAAAVDMLARRIEGEDVRGRRVFMDVELMAGETL